MAFDLVEGYTEAFKNFGYSDEDARKYAGLYVGGLYAIQGAYGLNNAKILVKQFGKDIAKPNVTSPKGSNTGAGNNWGVNKDGAYSPKDNGTVTNVGKGNSEFDGKTIYDANGSVYEGGVWKPKVTNGSQHAIDKAIDKEQLANPISQSRINIQNGNAKAGWEHLVKRHFSGKPNASQFTISQSEVKSLLQNHDVTKVPISKIQTSDNKATGQKEILYQRVVTLDKLIGIDKFSNKSTNTMTILTDKHGNLVTATLGVID
ncbi:hypothetical protein WKS79_002064 [Providencia stuartii]|uniref:hypothetical protein n=1 Tax=Providencia TaxID=586 RepID=UPI001CA4FB8E|nr:hypothetical protein [Providencia stuartii]HEM8215416.1 hypothetical protein [Providencia stuartii]